MNQYRFPRVLDCCWLTIMERRAWPKIASKLANVVRCLHPEQLPCLYPHLYAAHDDTRLLGPPPWAIQTPLLPIFAPSPSRCTEYPPVHQTAVSSSFSLARRRLPAVLRSSKGYSSPCWTPQPRRTTNSMGWQEEEPVIRMRFFLSVSFPSLLPFHRPSSSRLLASTNR